MTWKDNLRPASFRGFDFFVQDTTSNYGRRTSIHEYPFRDLPFVEDLGRKARLFTIEGFIIGDDYMSLRDQFIDLCEQSGSGLLIHPYLGEIDVVVTDFSISETYREGRMARFSINFVEAGVKQFPQQADDSKDLIVQARERGQQFALSDFAAAITVLNVSEYIRDSVKTEFNEIYNRLEKIAFGRILPNSENTTAKYLGSIFSAKTNIDTDISNPTELGSTYLSILNNASEITSPETQRIFSTHLFNYNPKVTETITAENNSDALNTFFKTTLVLKEAEALVNINFDTFEEALEARDNIISRISRVEGSVGDDVFSSLQDTKAILVKSVPGKNSDLPRLQEVQPKPNDNAILLSYRNYDNLDRIEEITLRNKLENPAIITNQRVQLKVNA